MKVNCSHTKLVNIKDLKTNPRNPNVHPENQILLLAKILKASGWRSPVVVSNLSGLIVKGHGRLQAAKVAGFNKVPVDFQDYETAEEETADLIADNRLAELSDFDGQILKDLIEELDTGKGDLDLTGYDQKSLEQLMSQFHVDAVDEEAEYDGMPKVDLIEESFRKLIVHFDNENDVKDFQLKLGLSKLTEKTTSMYWPWKDRATEAPNFE